MTEKISKESNLAPPNPQGPEHAPPAPLTDAEMVANLKTRFPSGVMVKRGEIIEQGWKIDDARNLIDLDESGQAISKPLGQDEVMVVSPDGESVKVINTRTLSPEISNALSKQLLAQAERAAKQLISEAHGNAPTVTATENGITHETDPLDPMENALSDVDSFMDALEFRNGVVVARKSITLLNSWNRLKAEGAAAVVLSDEMVNALCATIEADDRGMTIEDDKSIIMRAVEDARHALYGNNMEEIRQTLDVLIQSNNVANAIHDIDLRFKKVRALFDVSETRDAVELVRRAEVGLNPRSGESDKSHKERLATIKLGGGGNFSNMLAYRMRGETVDQYKVRLFEESRAVDSGTLALQNTLFGHPEDPRSVSVTVLRYQSEAERIIDDLRRATYDFRSGQRTPNSNELDGYLQMINELAHITGDNIKRFVEAVG